MMTSSNGNIFRVTGYLCGEFTGPGKFPAQRPVTRSFDVFFTCTRINGWVNNSEDGDLRSNRTHYDVTVMWNPVAAQCKEPDTRLRQNCSRAHDAILTYFTYLAWQLHYGMQNMNQLLQIAILLEEQRAHYWIFPFAVRNRQHSLVDESIIYVIITFLRHHV